MADPTPEEMLAQAVKARHELLTGTAKVSMRFGERSMEYTRATLAELERYIAELRRQVAADLGPVARRSRIRYAVPD